MLRFIYKIFHESPPSSPSTSHKNSDLIPKSPSPPLLSSQPINQNHLSDRLNTYLSFFIDKNDKRESLPPDATKGLCNGYSLLLLRADILGERAKFLSRLHCIAESNDLKLKDTADLVVEFRAAFQQTTTKEPSLDKQLFKIKIKACKGNKKKIATLKNERYEKLKAKTIETMSLSQDEKKLLEFGLDLYDFANSLIFAQSALNAVQLRIRINRRERPISQNDILEILKVITPDNWKKYKEVFRFNFLFYDEEFVKTLENNTQNGDFIVISIKDHVMYLVKSNDKYILYNPNFKVDPIEFNSAQQLFFDKDNGIRKSFFRNDEPIFMYELEVITNRVKKENNKRTSVADAITNIFNMRAIKAKNLDLKNCDIDIQDPDGDTALNNSIRFNQLAVTKELIARGANPNIPNKAGCFPLIQAANAGNIEMIRAILTSNTVKTDIDIKDSDGNTALNNSTRFNQLAVTKELIARGANPNIPSNTGWFPLTRAASAGNVKMIRAILSSHTVKIDIAPDDKMTALHWAAHSGWAKAAEILIAKGADVNISSGARGPAICIAASSNYIEIVRMLAESKADLIPLFSSYPNILIQILLQIKNIKNLDSNSLKKFNEPKIREKLFNAFIQYIQTVTDQELKKNILLSVVRKENALGIIFDSDFIVENSVANSMLFLQKKTNRQSSTLAEIQNLFKDILSLPTVKLVR